MPWPAGGEQPIRRLRHLCRRGFFAERPAWQRWLLHAAMTIAWPMGAAVEVLRHEPRLPPVGRSDGGWGRLRRAAHMLGLALGENVPPRDYVLLRMHDRARRAWGEAGLPEAETRALNARLRGLTGASILDVQDKSRFARLCRENGLPFIPTLAEFRGGERIAPDGPFTCDLPLLWTKDIAGFGGAGSALWRRDGDRYRNDEQGLVLTPPELESLWRRRDCLVQPCLRAHAALTGLSPGQAIVDFRVVSGIDRVGEVSIIAARAQIPCGGENPRWNILAGIERDGRLCAPYLAGYLPISHHPDTGVDLTEVIVPYWREALDLVVRAHRDVPEFARFAFLGWDVAIVEEGPVLIETNAGWGSRSLEAGDGPPLGRTPLPAIALDHLEGGGACD